MNKLKSPPIAVCLVTIGCVLAALVVAMIPLHGAYHAASLEFLTRSDFFGIKTYFGGVPTRTLNGSWLALLPAFLAITLVRSLMMIPSFRRLSRPNWLGWAELLLTLPIAIALAVIYTSKLSSAGLISTPVLSALQLTATSMVLAALAQTINRLGWGNGYVLIPAAAWFTGIPQLMKMLSGMFSVHSGVRVYSPFHALAILVISVCTIVGLFFLVKSWNRKRTVAARGRDSMGLILAVLMSAATYHMVLFFLGLFRLHLGGSILRCILFGFISFATCLLVVASQAKVTSSEQRSRRPWALGIGVACLVSVPLYLCNHLLNIPSAVSETLVSTGMLAFAGAILMLLRVGVQKVR